MTIVSHEMTSPEEILGLSLREIGARFGGVTGFAEWVKAMRVVEDVGAKRLKNLEASGRLISRELVQTSILGMLDVLHRRLLSDHPKNVAKRLAPLLPNVDAAAVERIVSDDVATQLTAARKRIEAALKDRSDDD